MEGTNSYAYDARGQLTAVTYPDGNSETFAYDPVGNRIHLGGSGSTPTNYTYGPANRLLFSKSAVETNVYTFDDAGRLVGQTVNGQPRSYGYDFMSRMTSLTDTNGSVFSYAFDGEGNRIRQSLNDCLSTRFVYDGANAVVELSAEGGSAYGGNVSNEVVWAWVNRPGLDQPVERIAFIGGTPRNRQVFHTAGLGSVFMLTDESGGGIQTYSYAAFGGIRARAGTDLNRVTFTARETIGDSRGFYFFRNRIVDPNIGRFTSEDPLGFVDGANLYLYVVNNPVALFDPLGLAYFAYCNLKGWIPMNNHPLLNVLNIGIYHEHLFFEDEQGGDIGYFGDNGGTLGPDPSPSGYRKRWGKCYDDALMRKAVENVKLEPYHLFFKPSKEKSKYNCQDWASDVRREYKRLLKERERNCK